MSHRSHTVSTHSSSPHRRREREERDTLRRDYGAEEARCVTAEMQHDDLTQRLVQLQKEFDDFRQVATIPSCAPTPGPILQKAQPAPQTNPIPSVTFSQPHSAPNRFLSVGVTCEMVL